MSAPAPAPGEPLIHILRRWLLRLMLLATSIMLLTGVVMVAATIDWTKDVLQQVGSVWMFAGYLIEIAIQSFSTVPGVAVYVSVLVLSYVLAPWVLARTRGEKRVALCHIVVAPLAAGLCVMAVVIKVFAGLAM